MNTLTKISAIAAATIAAAAVIGTTPAAGTPPETYTAVTTPATTNNTPPPIHTIGCGIFTTPTTQHTITAELPVAPVGASHLTTL